MQGKHVTLPVLTTAGLLGWVGRCERQRVAEGHRKKPDGTISGSRLARGEYRPPGSTFVLHGRPLWEHNRLGPGGLSYHL